LGGRLVPEVHPFPSGCGTVRDRGCTNELRARIKAELKRDGE
jgi:hypothetical protein